MSRILRSRQQGVRLQATVGAAAGGGAQSWPASLRSYVERAFAQKIPAEKKGALNVALKQIISDAQASNAETSLCPAVSLARLITVPGWMRKN